MDDIPPPVGADARPTLEMEARRRSRLASEAEGVAKADADIAAGRMVDEAKVDAWIDSIGTDHELPAPRARR